MPTMEAAAELKDLLRYDFEGEADLLRVRGAQDRQYLAAAEMLGALASTVDQIPEYVLAAWSELFEDLPDIESYNEMLREIGFTEEYSSATEFLKALIARQAGGSV